jgi:hypothetical protein
MDLSNPAVAQQTILTPKDIADIRDNPELMELVARGMGAVNLDNLFRQMQHPDVPIPHKIEFQKMLNKMGRLEPKETAAAAGGGFVFNINFGDGNTMKVEAAREPTAIDGVVEESSFELPVGEA